MLNTSHIALLLLLYIIILFAIAQWAQSPRQSAQRIGGSATTYAFSLAVFCTSWTFFGNVAVSTKQGLFPISLYLGATLTFIFLTPLLKKMILLKNEFHSTSIADFISVRYHRSQVLAALISIICLIGIVPYLTIQLKSVITSFQVLTNNADSGLSSLPYFDIFIVLMMSFFTIIFGVRHLDPTEKHPGMMVALAFESIFKLIAFIIAALWICYLMNPGVLSIFSQVKIESNLASISTLSLQNWLSFMLIGALGVITLPRQFHVSIVECTNSHFLDRAKWLFPLYLLLINLFVLPIALAGMAKPHLLDTADLLLLNLPLSADATLIAMIVFLGGFAAATGMIMVSAMTLSTMLTNHILMPAIMHFSILAPLKHNILPLRWLMVVAVLFLSLFYYHAIGNSQLIVNIGAISFIACAQFAPALLGGIVWAGGNVKGAIAGISAGAIIWFYSSLLPSVIRSGWLDWPILEQESGIFYWLNPEHFLAIEQITPLTNSLLWSLLINTLLYVGVSLFSKMSDEERKIAHQFVDINNIQYSKHYVDSEPANILLADKLSIIDGIFHQYMPNTDIKNKLSQCLNKANIRSTTHINILELSNLKNAALNMLAGTIGMASAYSAFKRLALINHQEELLLASYFSRFFAQLQLSPKELFEQVNFHQQKREMLENHAKQQLTTIEKLEREVTQRLSAEKALTLLNEELELRVGERTQALSQSNTELSNTLLELKQAQSQLLENEKMASLGGLVAGVAHEVNTPIGIVLTSISFMRDKCNAIVDALHEQTLSAKQLDKFIEELQLGFTLSLTNIERAVELIESFKLIAVDSVVDDARELNLNSYLGDILRSLRPKAKHGNITITLNCPDDINIYSYPGALTQITNNLVLNSLTHAFEGQTQGKISITAIQQEDKIILIYSDDGNSLDETSKLHIFEPFYTTKRGQGGSGLGAHIVYNLVTQRLKGNIEIITEQVKGKSFKIEIPIDISSAITTIEE